MKYEEDDSWKIIWHLTKDDNVKCIEVHECLDTQHHSHQGIQSQGAGHFIESLKIGDQQGMVMVAILASSLEVYCICIHLPHNQTLPRDFPVGEGKI